MSKWLEKKLREAERDVRIHKANYDRAIQRVKKIKQELEAERDKA